MKLKPQKPMLWLIESERKLKEQLKKQQEQEHQKLKEKQKPPKKDSEFLDT